MVASRGTFVTFHLLALVGIACAGTPPNTGDAAPNSIPRAVNPTPSEATSEPRIAAPSEATVPLEDFASDSATPAPAANAEEQKLDSYPAVVTKVERMVSDPDLQARVQARGLSLVNVAWEDTGRAEGSAVGPNITDLTLEVRYGAAGPGPRTALMPVIRFPNFTDLTADIRADRLFIRTGNHRAGADSLRTRSLEEVIENLRLVLSEPKELKGHGNLHALRDTHFLVSAQAVFLPIPASGKATFNPVVFNYQSAPESPAVMTLLVTRQGTSATVIENRDEDSVHGWGQELYFNEGGKRARFTAERAGDVEARIAAQGGAQSEDDRSALARGADVLMLVQIPLKHRHRGALGGLVGSSGGMAFGGLGLFGSGSGGGGMGYGAGVGRGSSNVERAVLGHGDVLGEFNETSGLKLVRDARFPVRVTVQFYKATSNGVVSDADLDGIARSIGDVYEHADFVGSLVIPEDDARRPTAWQTVPGEWFPW